MGMYTVQQGDCLSKLAKAFGLPSWKSIYDHELNAEFRALRPNPNVIYPKDRVYIPDPQSKDTEGASERRHSFRQHREPTFLRVRVLDANGNAMANRAYTLTIENADYDGVTSSQGVMVQRVPANATDAVLRVAVSEDNSDVRVEWRLGIGKLDPVNQATGVQARLNNLRYPCGEVDGIIGPLTDAAIRHFQEENDLAVDGIAGPQTQGKLEELHGC